MTKSGTSPQDELVTSLCDSVWVRRLHDFGGAEEAWLDQKVAHGLPNVDSATYDRRADDAATTLREVEGLRGHPLSTSSRESLDVLEYQLRVQINNAKWRDYEAPATSDSAPWVELIDRARTPIHTLADADAYLQQLADIPRYLEQVIANMRAGIRRGFGPPRISMAGRAAIVETVARDGSDNPFRSVFNSLPQWLGKEAVAMRRQAGLQLVTEGVIPSFRNLSEFLTTTYLPHLPTETSSVARCGEEYYRDQIYRHCAMKADPREIHEQGLTAVEGILSEMRIISRRVGFGERLGELFAFMRTSEQFYARTPQELLNEAAWEAKMFDGVVEQYFGVIPRSRFTIREPASDLAPFYTFGRGGISLYTLNTYPLSQRPFYSLPALTLHEAAPGHTFQVALALENADLPEFRRKSYIPSYGEGWALYCERLGVEMGMYRTDYELLGMLSFQMWRAARMVIDPGIHAMGWTREQAMKFLSDNTAIGGHEVMTEIDRYISWPGQAPAYAIGQAVIEKLRNKAEVALGPRFRLPDFHDRVLSRGCLPLNTLETSIDEWMADQSSALPVEAHRP